MNWRGAELLFNEQFRFRIERGWTGALAAQGVIDRFAHALLSFRASVSKLAKLLCQVPKSAFLDVISLRHGEQVQVLNDDLFTGGGARSRHAERRTQHEVLRTLAEGV